MPRLNNISYNEGGDNMKNYIVLSMMLALILITVSLLLDDLMGIFIVSVVVCFVLTLKDKDIDHTKP